jgi:hypothetical protein
MRGHGPLELGQLVQELSGKTADGARWLHDEKRLAAEVAVRGYASVGREREGSSGIRHAALTPCSQVTTSRPCGRLFLRRPPVSRIKSFQACEFRSSLFGALFNVSIFINQRRPRVEFQKIVNTMSDIVGGIDGLINSSHGAPFDALRKLIDMKSA